MEVLFMVLNGLVYFIIADAILSWVQSEGQFPRSLTSKVTAPLYAPIHAIMPPEKTGGLDLSPIVVIVLIQVIQRALVGAL